MARLICCFLVRDSYREKPLTAEDAEFAEKGALSA